MIKVLFQGDSITDGNRVKDPEKRWDLNHQIGHSYVFIIASKLGYQYPGKFEFVNRGVSGDSVNTILNRWKKDTIDESPDILSILLGINGNGKRDGQYEEGVEKHLADFERNYRELLKSACQSNPNLKLIIIEPFALPVGDLKERYDCFMAVFRRKQNIVRKLANEFNSKFISIQEPLEYLIKKTKKIIIENDISIDPYKYWLWDGIHATEAMHMFIAEQWIKTFNEIMPI